MVGGRKGVAVVAVVVVVLELVLAQSLRRVLVLVLEAVLVVAWALWMTFLSMWRAPRRPESAQG